MKKFISFLLTFVMLFSLTMPAMAAEVTGDTGKNVTASYTPSPVTYTVTVNTSENGTVTANPTEGVEGTSITLTVDPAEGYELDQLTIKDASDGEVTWAEGYTFNMPASNVTVSATFKEVVVPTYAINIDADIENGTVVSDKAEAKKDDSVTLTITPDEGYELDTLTVGSVDVTTDVQNGKYTFNMGEVAVEVTATFKKISYTITIDSAIVNGTVSAPANATFGDTVVLTVSADAKYELGTVTVTRNDTDAEVTVTDKTFTMPAANVTVTATFNALPVTSVSISWGSMSFVYDDTVAEGATKETGWTCAEGANLVTVTNGDESAITASVEYKPETGYEAIKGYFADTSATASADLNLNASHVFTLTLDGKPEDAITAGTKIGSVTVTITESTPATEITTLAELESALANGGSYKLGGAIDLGQTALTTSQNIKLDMNGYKLSSSATGRNKLTIESGGYFTASGSNFQNSFYVNEGATLVLNDGEYGKGTTVTTFPVYTKGTLIVNGAPTFNNSSSACNIEWYSGTIDLSGYTGDGITIHAGNEMSLSVITLPAGYSIYNYRGTLLESSGTISTNYYCTVKPTE